MCTRRSTDQSDDALRFLDRLNRVKIAEEMVLLRRGSPSRKLQPLFFQSPPRPRLPTIKVPSSFWIHSAVMVATEPSQWGDPQPVGHRMHSPGFQVRAHALLQVRSDLSVFACTSVSLIFRICSWTLSSSSAEASGLRALTTCLVAPTLPKTMVTTDFR